MKVFWHHDIKRKTMALFLDNWINKCSFRHICIFNWRTLNRTVASTELSLNRTYLTSYSFDQDIKKWHCDHHVSPVWQSGSWLRALIFISLRTLVLFYKLFTSYLNFAYTLRNSILLVLWLNNHDIDSSQLYIQIFKN